ncbi:MAG: hypothetical protein FJ404_16680 [Verrucomicrobia bacterium]|nr:hypothetical protein [Verrucomicrobiota bacterium]
MNAKTPLASNWERLIPWGFGVFAVWLAIQHRETLNTDGVAYLRLASYWSEGKWGLAISGYWGPLLPWIMALFLRIGVESLLAAHLAMAVSAALFAWNAHQLFLRLKIPTIVRMGANFATGMAAAVWSSAQISPDLLVGSWILAALGAMMEQERSATTKGLLRVAFYWSMAYHAKAIALPLALATTLAAWLAQRLQQRGDGTSTRSWAKLAGLIFLFSAPWILVLSLKYGTPTFSTTGKIAHAIVGPSDQERYHPFGRTLHQPEPGRLTAWEDPSRMAYRYWSPFESRAYFDHQLGLLYENSLTILGLLWTLDGVGFGLAALIASLAWWRSKEPLRLAASPVLYLVAPVMFAAAAHGFTYVQTVDLRYFFFAQPLLLALCLVGIERWNWIQSRRPLGRALVIASFLAVPGSELSRVISPAPATATQVGKAMADRLKQANVVQPIAGSAFYQGQRIGLYVAYFLGTTWIGDSPTDPAPLVGSASSTTVIIHRNSPFSAALTASGLWRSLDEQLFTSPTEAQGFPLEAFVRSRP